MATSEEENKAPPKKKAPTHETVINIMGSKGNITSMSGERIPPGGSCELPVALCEKLVAAGKARYLTKAEQGSG